MFVFLPKKIAIVSFALNKNINFYIYRAYDLFKQSAELNHIEAGKIVGQAYFFGDVFAQNLTAAKDWFERLSQGKGSPFAQMVKHSMKSLTFYSKYFFCNL